MAAEAGAGLGAMGGAGGGAAEGAGAGGGMSPDQRAKLQSELDVVQGNMAVLGEMLSETTPGQEQPGDLELLQVSVLFIGKIHGKRHNHETYVTKKLTV